MSLTIRTQNLIIRQFSETDLVEFAAYRAIPAVAEYQTWSNFTYVDALAKHAKMIEVPFGTVGSWFQLAIKKGEVAPLAGDDLELALMAADQDRLQDALLLDRGDHFREVAEILAGLVRVGLDALNVDQVADGIATLRRDLFHEVAVVAHLLFGGKSTELRHDQSPPPRDCNTPEHLSSLAQR